MGLFSRRRETHVPREADAIAPEEQAYDQVWNREVELLGRDEVLRRLGALSDYRNGRSGPSGFENWSRQLELEIINLAKSIARREAVRGTANDS